MPRGETDTPPLCQTAGAQSHEAEPDVITSGVEWPCVPYVDDARRLVQAQLHLTVSETKVLPVLALHSTVAVSGSLQVKRPLK